MKKILSSIAFIGGFVTVLLLLGIVFKPEEELNRAYAVDRKLVDYETDYELKYDVMFYGDSLSYTSFIPAYLWKHYGITSYNFGCANGKLNDVYYLMKETLLNQHPKVVVLETDSFFVYAGKYMDADDNINNVFYDFFPVLRYHNRWKTLLNSTKLFDKESESAKNKGYICKKVVVPYEGGQWMNKTTEEEPLGENVEKYFHKIVEMVEENGAKLVLVSTVSPLTYNYSKHNSLVKLSEKYGIDYYDFNLDTDVIGVDMAKDTYDGGYHPNYRLACKLSRYFGKVLSEKYSIKSHLGDPDYENWNKWLKTIKYQLK